MEQIIEQAEVNIHQALADYRAHTRETAVLDDVADEFIRTLARDSSRAKQGLRELLSKSPVWDERIDALVINGTRTHNPDYNHIRRLARDILCVPLSGENSGLVAQAIDFFAYQNLSDAESQSGIGAINTLAPKAYSPTKKRSRIFKALCTALGVADETAGSDFQRLYAQFADELTSKKISFKLYVSINPAHFLTMSNPKWDERGCTLTSCHSFNSTEYEYNNGCAGYARDGVSFIVFTVSDPKEPETLNNRKTTRQVFAYRPGSGLLMQSRMYNTSGGTHGAVEDSKLYRDLVQREISALENVPNLWKTFSSVKDEVSGYVNTGCGFGGYPDWTYNDFDGHISFREDCDRDSVSPLEVGASGLCIMCGEEISNGLYCDDCEGSYTCGHCGCRCGETFTVIDGGEEQYVCEDCRDEHYSYCDECETYHDGDTVFYADGRNVCDSCREEYYEECEECGDWHRREDMHEVYNSQGNEIWVCDDCFDNYSCCEECGDCYPMDDVVSARKSNGACVHVCEDCRDKFVECPHCGELIEMCDDGTCPVCGAFAEEENEEVAE